MRCRDTAAAAVLTAALAVSPHGAALAQVQPAVDEFAESVIRRAEVWIPTDIGAMNLRTGATGPQSFAPAATVTCEYLNKKLDGASPKFACRLPDGDEPRLRFTEELREGG